MADFLELFDVRKEFGDFAALKGVSLAIRQGELVCFLGPSGCGKTTLLRIIAGLEVQSAGTIVQAGRDISRLPPMERDYGIVFQSYALFPNLSVADNVAYGLVNRRMARPSRARSPPRPASSCSTSPCPRSMRACGCACGARSAACSSASESRPSSSPT